MNNYVSAGVFFTVTLGFLRSGKAKENHLTHGDGLADTDVMNSLNKLIRGDNTNLPVDLLKTPLSRFKTCTQNPRDYIPFNDRDLSNSFHMRFLRRESRLLEDAFNFLEAYIDPAKYEQYVKALIEFTELDKGFIYENDLLASSSEQINYKSLKDETFVNLSLFFLSFLDVLLMNRRDNTEGREMFENICEKSGNAYVYKGRLGEKYQSHLNIKLEKTDEIEVLINTESNYARLPSGPVEIIDDNIIIDGKAYPIPEGLVPKAEIEQMEEKYIRALFEIYSELENKGISLENLPTKRKPHFKSQRQAFYAAYSLERTAVKIFGKPGADEYDRLVDEAFHGIEMILQDDYETGYKRLQDVLYKITSTSLDGSRLRWLTILLTNLTKKGLCHVMVNRNQVHSWVSPYENFEE